MTKKWEGIPTRLASDQLLRVIAEQNDELLSLMREQNRLLKGEKGDGIPVTQVELTEPAPAESKPPAAKAPAKAPARSTTTTRKS